MSGSSTRDWLLDKLMKLRQAMTELKVDYEAKLAAKDTSLNAAQNRIINLQGDLVSSREEWTEMRNRLLQVSTSKGFRVVFRGSSLGADVRLEILAVNHCNGETVITVQRAP
jgi:predicted RNase H-like nuclease (RuvC/YqgF family)